MADEQIHTGGPEAPAAGEASWAYALRGIAPVKSVTAAENERPMAAAR